MNDRIIKQRFKRNPITNDALKIVFNYNVYKKKYKFLKKSQIWNKEQIGKYQLSQLKLLVQHAYKNVPYYIKLFDKVGLHPKDISSINDLQKLPFLSKETIKLNIQDFKAKNYPAKKFEFNTTGGTTGFPLGFYIEKGVAQATHMAFFQIFLDQLNCHFLNKQVHLIGSDDICTYSIFRRIMILSSSYMNDKNLPLYIKKIRFLKPKFVLAFPSALVKLAKYMNKNHLKSFPSIQTIICSGETIYDWQRILIEKTFNCKIYTLYAHNEIAVFGTSCPVSNNYHMYPEYGIVELINKEGKQATNEGEIGEIIVTGFNNYII